MPAFRIELIKMIDERCPKRILNARIAYFDPPSLASGSAIRPHSDLSDVRTVVLERAVGVKSHHRRLRLVARWSGMGMERET